MDNSHNIISTVREPTLHYITIATKPHVVLDKIKQRVAIQNESLSVLGEHENRNIGWNATGNFGIKLKEVQSFIMNPEIDKDDIVLFTDAYDVIYYGNRAEIIKRYLSFAHPIVFGAEKFCNPIPSYEKHYTFKDTEFPFLNSGMFIGRVWALRECIGKYVYNDKHDDQQYWTLQFINRPELIKLDYNNTLFLNSVGLDVNSIRHDGNRCFYKEANPLFLHINGPDKSEIRHFM